MATSFLGRALISKPTFASLVAHSFTSSSLARVPSVHPNLRFLIAVKEYYQPPAVTGVHYFSTRPTTSSLNDPSPNWFTRPPKETILEYGCDFEHWLVYMKRPDENATRDDIIDSYIKTLAQLLGSEDEARKKIYSVSTRCYFAFGCLVSEELAYKIQELPKVSFVVPDSYLNLRTKDYGGEPFIDGKAVPYDPKYHEECGVQNNPTYPNQGPGGAPANPGYQNQGVRGAPTIKVEDDSEWEVYDEYGYDWDMDDESEWKVYDEYDYDWDSKTRDWDTDDESEWEVNDEYDKEIKEIKIWDWYTLTYLVPTCG